MWRFEFILTVTVMMMHMYLHLGGRGITITFALFFFSFLVCEHRCAANPQCQRRIILWLHCMVQYRCQVGPSKKPPDSKKKKTELVLFL